MRVRIRTLFSPPNRQVTASFCGFTGIAYFVGVHCIALFEGTDVRKLTRMLEAAMSHGWCLV